MRARKSERKVTILDPNSFLFHKILGKKYLVVSVQCLISFFSCCVRKQFRCISSGKANNLALTDR